MENRFFYFILYETYRMSPADESKTANALSKNGKKSHQIVRCLQKKGLEAGQETTKIQLYLS